MSRALTFRMPIIRVKIPVGPVTLRHLEQGYDNRCEPWPRSIPKELEVDALIDTGASVTIIDTSIVEDVHCHFHLDGPGDCFEITAPEPFVDEISSVSVAGA